MADEEYEITDTTGRFTIAVKDGRKLNDISWNSGRILLSNKRLILVGNDGKRTIKLAEITGLSGREDATQSIAALSNYLSVKVGDDVIVVAPNDHEDFKTDFFEAMLGETVVKAKHPAVEGGVVQDHSWETARLSIEPESLLLTMKGGGLVELELDEISGIATEKRTVSGGKRTVIEVSHAEGTTTVETHLTGSSQTCIFVQAFLREGERRSETNVDLDPSEEEVLMALYSGVSPFSIPEFIGQEIAAVEETFEKFMELDIVDEVRQRREVTLNSRGRAIASDAIDEQ